MSFFDFAWVKAYVPRSLYGRAALILLVPIVTLQLVVSVVFIQRHYEGVTDQMTRSVALELRHLRDVVEAAPDLAAARAALAGIAAPLAFRVALPDTPAAPDPPGVWDFSGRQMIETLQSEMEGVTAVDLEPDSKSVSVWLTTRYGPLRAAFDRGRVSASNPHQLLVLMLLTGALMTVIAYLFLRNQLRPIERLARAASEFGRGRVVPYRPAGATEVRAAGNAFLDMRARIERQIEQRTMMLSGVSHDMRTPLTRLRLGLSMLEDAEAAELARDVEELERLLDEFLTFAREETLGDPEPCDPVALVRDVVARSGAAVRLTEVSGEGPAMLRPMAVSRALENLIGNAMRYARACELRVVVSGRAVRIVVEDDGPGIPEDRREEALKPFARLDAARNQDRGSGVGLGLAIAQDIARRHGGSLILGESDRLGGLRVDLVLAR
ncbi:ATP-binding protein [Psychromarinibacter sp. C21-152]|uniref:histidine kinase n=1 Tax=Psychromarinibacter sediminicola TaxID=3033385 RepID=A0AAE3TA92_9RHOB|nr:ATP-binding protein [Psychromarinibacter sediminicola]MDF0603455.1 ATP-binding protein [Psychromarinibacter sediminicola]